MEIPVIERSMQSSISRSNSFQLDIAFWEVGSAAVEHLRCKASMAAQGQRNFGPKRYTERQKSIGFHIIPASWNLNKKRQSTVEIIFLHETEMYKSKRFVKLRETFNTYWQYSY